MCQDFQTGKLVWNEKGKLGKGSLVYADGMLYLRAEDGKGTVALIEATPDGYQEKGPLRSAAAERQKQLAASGGDWRSALPARSGRAAVLRRWQAIT